MLEEIILRLSPFSKSVDICSKDLKNNIRYKEISAKKFFEIVKDYADYHKLEQEKLMLLEPGIIAKTKNKVLIRQEGSKKYVSLNLYNKDIKSYHINFPNALYLVEFNNEKITNIKAYSYIEWKNENTKLFEYPLPNMLSGNRICIGSANRSIKNGKVVEALERIIFTSYSHERLDGNITGFSKTDVYFQYLEKNPFPYKQLKKLNKKIKDILK